MNGVENLALALGWRLAAASAAGGAAAAAVWLVCRRRPELGSGTQRWLWWAVSLVMLLGLVPLPAWRVAVLPPGLAMASSGALEPVVEEPREPRTREVSPRHAGAVAARQAEGAGASTVAASGAAGAADGVASRAARLQPPEPGGTEPAGAPTAGFRRAAAALVALWAAGAFLALLAAARDLSRLRRLLRTASAAAPALAATFERLADALGVREARLRLLPGIDMPQVAGVLRPVVLLPADAATRYAAEELELTLAHELLHVRNRDLLLGLVPALAERLFFFHPLARLAAREQALAREAACDAGVLEALAPSPRAYGRLLLKLSLAPRAPLAAAMAVVTPGTLHRRLEMLLEPRRHSGRARWAWLALPVAFAALLPLRLTAVETPATAGADEPAVVVAPHAAAGRAPDGDPGGAAELAAAPVTTQDAVARPSAAPVGVVAALADDSARPAASAQPAQPAPPADAKLAGGEPWVLLHGDSTTMHGSARDASTARRFRRGDEPLLWARRDGVEWVVRDPEVLGPLVAALEPQTELGRKQAELGSRQAELGARQAALGEEQTAFGARQAKLGSRQAELAAEQAELAAQVARLAAEEARRALELDAEDAEARAEREAQRDAARQRRRSLEEQAARLAAEQAEIGADMGELGGRMGELGARQAELGALQGELGAQQGELGRRQAEIAHEVARQVDRLLTAAIRSGKAQRVD